MTATNDHSSRTPRRRKCLTAHSTPLRSSISRLLNNEYIPLVSAGKFAEANALRHQKLAPLRAEQSVAVDELLKHVDEGVKLHESDAATEASNAEMLMIVVVLGALGVVSLVVFLVSKHITTQVGKLQVAARALADGDMTHRIEAESADEIGGGCAGAERRRLKRSARRLPRSVSTRRRLPAPAKRFPARRARSRRRRTRRSSR